MKTGKLKIEINFTEDQGSKMPDVVGHSVDPTTLGPTLVRTLLLHDYM